VGKERAKQIVIWTERKRVIDNNELQHKKRIENEDSKNKDRKIIVVKCSTKRLVCEQPLVTTAHRQVAVDLYNRSLFRSLPDSPRWSNMFLISPGISCVTLPLL
jgi:hypothetical protein